MELNDLLRNIAYRIAYLRAKYEYYAQNSADEYSSYTDACDEYQALHTSLYDIFDEKVDYVCTYDSAEFCARCDIFYVDTDGKINHVFSNAWYK